MRVVAIIPQLRNAVIEAAVPGACILYFSKRAETDEQLLRKNEDVQRFTGRRFLRAISDQELRLLEVAEPMWIKEWPRQLALALICKFWRRLLGLPAVPVGVYAIENLHSNSRFVPPSLDKYPKAGSVFAWVSARAVDASGRWALDRVVAGTPGALSNYNHCLPRTMAHVDSMLMSPDLSPCGCVRPSAECGPGADPPRVLQYLGEGAMRKGLPTLLEAWRRCGDLIAEGWCLRLTGPGVASWGPDERGFIFEETVTRDEVYVRLEEASVVVLPSERVPRWREQIGLPIVEALRHGCTVVMTSESGIVDSVAARGDVYVVAPGDAAALAHGLREAATATQHRRSFERDWVHRVDNRRDVWAWLGRSDDPS